MTHDHESCTDLTSARSDTAHREPRNCGDQLVRTGETFVDGLRTAEMNHGVVRDGRAALRAAEYYAIFPS